MYKSAVITFLEKKKAECLKIVTLSFAEVTTMHEMFQMASQGILRSFLLSDFVVCP